MAQKLFWSWKDDDLTFNLDRWLLGLIEPAVYRGFDFTPTANWNLTLGHTVTGIIQVKKDLTNSPKTGIVFTKQGVVVQEDAAIVIPITPVSTLPRIDIIVLTHQYTDTIVGGYSATYSVVQGTPNATPVAPSILNAATDLKIGELYLPASAANLNAAGVTFAKTEKPSLGASSNLNSEVLSSDTSVKVSKNITVEGKKSFDLSINVTELPDNTTWQSSYFPIYAFADITNTGVFSGVIKATGKYKVKVFFSLPISSPGSTSKVFLIDVITTSVSGGFEMWVNVIDETAGTKFAFRFLGNSSKILTSVVNVNGIYTINAPVNFSGPNALYAYSVKNSTAYFYFQEAIVYLADFADKTTFSFPVPAGILVDKSQNNSLEVSLISPIRRVIGMVVTEFEELLIAYLYIDITGVGSIDFVRANHANITLTAFSSVAITGQLAAPLY